MNERLISRILLLNVGDRLIVDREDKPGVVQFKSTNPGEVEFSLDNRTFVVELKHADVARALSENEAVKVFGESPVMFLMSPSEDLSATID